MILDNLWQEFLQISYVEVGSRAVETWFKVINFVNWDSEGKIIFLKAPNKFIKDWVLLYYKDFLQKNLARLLNEEKVQIVFLEEVEATFEDDNFRIDNNNFETIYDISETNLNDDRTHQTFCFAELNPQISLASKKENYSNEFKSKPASRFNDNKRVSSGFAKKVCGNEPLMRESNEHSTKGYNDYLKRSGNENLTINKQTGSNKSINNNEQTKDYSVPAISLKGNSLMAQNNLFDTFIVGSNNLLAYAAADSVTQNSGALYNPLGIYGGSGLGKTHLLQAIGHKCKQNNKKVLYQSAERFTSEFVMSVRNKSVQQFENRYKAVDVWLVDDIQFFSQKKQTQEMFLQIFNNFKQNQKQLVFTCNDLPRNVEGFSDRLWSRLESGLTTDIQPASLETKKMILQRKAKANNISLQEETATLMASRVSNIRDLESSLIRVMAYSSLTNQPLNEDLVGQVILPLPEKKQEPTLDHIIKYVSKYYRYSVEEIKSSKRTKNLANARQITVYLMRTATQKSLREIANFLGKRDHSTILHAYTKIETQRKSNAEIDSLLRKFEREIRL